MSEKQARTARNKNKNAPRVRATKEEVINVRCTADQKASLESVAAREGLGVSTWLLHVGLRVAQERKST